MAGPRTPRRASKEPSRRRQCVCLAGAAIAAAGFVGRSQMCCFFSIASYMSLFMSLVHQTELVMRVDSASGLPKMRHKQLHHSQSKAGGNDLSAEHGRAASEQPKAATTKKLIEWCKFSREGELCSTMSPGWAPGKDDQAQCTPNSPKCKWFPPESLVAVIFSDRLIKSGMVTMTSLCRHPTTLYVLVLMQVSDTYKPIPQNFLSCKTISMTMLDGLQYIRKA